MYKKASQVWNRTAHDTPTGDNSFVKEAKRAASQYLSEAKKKKIVVCEFCSINIKNSDLGDHIFFEHNLSKCKFCKQFISSKELHDHIKQIHGEKEYLKWKGEKDKKKIMQLGEPATWIKEEKSLDETPKNCKFCNLIVPSHLMDFHTQNYCKNKPSKVRR